MASEYCFALNNVEILDFSKAKRPILNQLANSPHRPIPLLIDDVILKIIYKILKLKKTSLLGNNAVATLGQLWNKMVYFLFQHLITLVLVFLRPGQTGFVTEHSLAFTRKHWLLCFLVKANLWPVTKPV